MMLLLFVSVFLFQVVVDRFFWCCCSPGGLPTTLHVSGYCLSFPLGGPNVAISGTLNYDAVHDEWNGSVTTKGYATICGGGPLGNIAPAFIHLTYDALTSTATLYYRMGTCTTNFGQCGFSGNEVPTPLYSGGTARAEGTVSSVSLSPVLITGTWASSWTSSTSAYCPGTLPPQLTGTWTITS